MENLIKTLEMRTEWATKAIRYPDSLMEQNKNRGYAEGFAEALKVVKLNNPSVPVIERLGGDFLTIMENCRDEYTAFFEDAEEIGSSDINCFLHSFFKGQYIDPETVSNEDWSKFKQWGCCMND